MYNFIKRHKLIFQLLLLGLIVRLLFMFFFNSTFDFFNILAISKSVSDTGNLTDGFFVLKRNGLEVQLYGKLYYQLTALWLKILEAVKVLDIRYLFDTKAYQGAADYMVGLFHWGPPLYQLISIKFLQLFYDGIFVYSLYNIAKLINEKYSKSILLFWAIVPFLMIVPYSVFQSDFTMLTFLTAGTYLWMKELSQPNSKPVTVGKVSTIILFALGAVIKQVPIVFLPLVIISFSRNIVTSVFYTLISLLAYLVIRQPWAADATLIQQFSLLSTESTAIFSFRLNGTSIFLFLYLLITLAVFLYRKSIFSDPKKVIYIIALLLAAIYLTEDSTLLFPQFNLWIIPFLALLTLIRKEYGLLLLAPIFGFFKRLMIGVDLSGLLNPTFGYGFNHLLDYKDLIRFASQDLLGTALTSFMAFLYICLAVLVLGDLFDIKSFENIREKLKVFKFSLIQIAVTITLGYYALFAIDMIVKTRVTLLPSPNYQMTSKLALSKKPIEVNVTNSERQTINGLELPAHRASLSYPDYTVFKFLDDKNNELFTQKVSDFTFPKLSDEMFNIPLNKPINNSRFKVLIYKEHNYNTIYFNSVKFTGDVMGGSIYNNPKDSAVLKLEFPKETFAINFRGQYGWNQIVQGVSYHLKSKPKFFIAYFSLIAILIAVLVFISLAIKDRDNSLTTN